MHGRSCTCLLAISVLMVALTSLRGQSGSVDAAPEFSLHLPGVDQPPTTSLPARLPTSPPGLPPGPIGFPILVRAAGAIFSGTVSAIARRSAAHGQGVETVAITFHVENAIRGATAGEDLTISQWIGLWSGGQRYRVGEHVLLFLYPPSKLGLTSCIAGAMGRFTIDPRGRVLLSAQHLSAFRTDPVLGGKSRVNFNDFAMAVQRSSGTTEQTTEQ
ncbi:MAG TPA: hypothetical protein VK812_19545 [Candidatus Binatus sp.]|jgi:hypothetical protein|nr:hypothetical protein [Candidatus Binatus sp.]